MLHGCVHGRDFKTVFQKVLSGTNALFSVVVYRSRSRYKGLGVIKTFATRCLYFLRKRKIAELAVMREKNANNLDNCTLWRRKS